MNILSLRTLKLGHSMLCCCVSLSWTQSWRTVTRLFSLMVACLTLSRKAAFLCWPMVLAIPYLMLCRWASPQCHFLLLHSHFKYCESEKWLMSCTSPPGRCWNSSSRLERLLAWGALLIGKFPHGGYSAQFPKCTFWPAEVTVIPQLLEGSLHSKVCSNLPDRSAQGQVSLQSLAHVLLPKPGQW